MTRAILRYLVRIFFALIALITLLLSPIAYIETMCFKDEVTSDFISMLPAEYHRTESRTFLTYPEWHIVNAYDEYAKVIQLGDPHDYEYLKSISGFGLRFVHYPKNQHRMVVLILKQSRQFILLASAFQQNLYSKVCMKKHLGVYQHGYVAINVVG